MVKSQIAYSELESAELVEALNKLTAALTSHSEGLKEHQTTMEHLSLAVEQLGSIIKQEIKRESATPSIQLKRVVIEFVESHINPLYYQGLNTPRLTGTPKISRISLPMGQKSHLQD